MVQDGSDPRVAGERGSILGNDDRREPDLDRPAEATSFGQLADRAAKRLEAVGDSLRTLWSVRKDRAQLAVRRRVQNVAVLGAASLAGGAAIIHATLLFVGGTAAGLGGLFGGRAWLGDLVAGALFLALIAGGFAVALRRWNQSQLAKQKKKYAELHRKRGPTVPGAPH